MNAGLNVKWLRFSIALVWLVSAVLPFMPSVHERGVAELMRLNLSNQWIQPMMYASQCMDMICAGLALLMYRPIAWLAQMGLVVFYTVVLTFSHSELWFDPFGSLLKNIPIVAIMWVMFQYDKQSNQYNK